MIYYFLIAFLFICGVLEIYCRDSQKKILFLAAYIVLYVFVAFKEAGGTDFLDYKDIFQNTNSLKYGFIGSIEPLFSSLIVVTKKLNGNFPVFWAFIAFINLGIKFYVFKKYSPFLFSALLIYLVGMFIERDFDGVRQGLAIGICFLSLKYVLQERLIPFLLLILIATTIHVSSIVFIVIYWLKNLKLSNKFIYLCVGASILFVIMHGSLWRLVLSFLPKQSMAAVKLGIYANSSHYSAEMGLNIGVIFRILILLLFISNRKKIPIDEKLYVILRNGFLFAIICSLLFHDFQVLAHRLPYAFREFQILIVPYFNYLVKGKANRVVLLVIIALYSSILMFRILSGRLGDAYLLYQNYLF